MAEIQFAPFQVVPLSNAMHDELVKETTADVARDALEYLGERLRELVHLHDIGCARGNVSKEFLALQPSDYSSPSNQIQVTATDVDEERVRAIKALAQEKGWPVTAAMTMKVEDMTFPDASFDISFANYVLYFSRNCGLDGLRQMYRTTRPGGYAIFTTWDSLPHFEPVRHAHEVAREGKGTLNEFPKDWTDAEFWIRMATEAGFDRAGIDVRRKTVTVNYADPRHMANMLWSWGGRPKEGWTQHDQDNWERYLDIIVDDFKTSPGFTMNPDGSVTQKMPAVAIIARK